MCYGGTDPKFMMRDIEERVKGVAFVREKSEEPGKLPWGGLLAHLWRLIRREKRKDLVHG